MPKPVHIKRDTSQLSLDARVRIVHLWVCPDCGRKHWGFIADFCRNINCPSKVVRRMRPIRRNP